METSNPLRPESGNSELSEREREILRLVATGASNKEIAQRLYISTNTVKVHLRNIFDKIGVASRTEAALYAVREGMVRVAGQAQLHDQGGNGGTAVEANPVNQTREAGRPAAWPPWAPSQVDRRTALWIALLAGLLVGTAILLIGLRQPTQVASPTPAPPTEEPSRWQARADLPTARSGLAATTYENQVYAIGGETAQSVTPEVERYDPASDTWTALAPKPLAAADVGAAVIGGQIYVPGGRTASGAVTDVLEVYDPHQDKWERRASLPVALSAYALVAFEGRLYLFGGWDGHEYLASVYEYDPSRDQWTERAAMPTARGYAAAAVAGGKIYVLGGTAGGPALSVNEEYAPESDASGEDPWKQRAPLPQGRFAMGIGSVADIIHVIGGKGKEASLPALEYFPQRDEWQSFDFPASRSLSGLGLAVVETNLHTLGGVQEAAPTARHLVYQAIYTVFIPVVR